jgi:hypothetical protein
MRKKYAPILIPVFGPNGQRPHVQACEKSRGLYACQEKGDGLYTEQELTSWGASVGRSIVLMKVEADYPNAPDKAA